MRQKMFFNSALKSILTLTIVALLLTACGGPAESDITATDPWARAASAMMGEASDESMEGMESEGETDEMAEEMEEGESEEEAEAMEAMDEGEGGMMAHDGGVSAAYMVLENAGAADRLISAETDVAGVVEIHTSEMDDEGVMRMRPLTDGLEIPANGSVTLQPGGYHIMLMELQQDLAEGETITLTLNLESGQSLTVEAEVRAP